MTHIAFDIGTTGTKAAVIAPDGRVLRSASRDYPTHTAAGGVVEQDPRDWLHAVHETMQAVAGEDVQAIVLSGQMQNLTLIGADGAPLRPTILYSDSRAHAEADAVRAAFSEAEQLAVTGNIHGADSLLAKLRWLKAHEPDALARARHLFIGAADVVAYLLTGAAASDTTTAATTGLLDLAARAPLDEAIFARLGIAEARDLLPPWVAGGALIGTLTAGWPLPEGTPVMLGPGDAGAATLGAGCGVEGRVYAYIGTSGWVAFTSRQRLETDARVFTLAHPDPARLLVIAPLLTAGGNLAWARDLFGESDYGAMIDAALSRPPSPLLYLPYLNGERSPFHDPFARGAFIGLSAAHTRADLVRAVLEGVVYAYRHALETLVGDPVASLTLTGGGTRSAAWSQLFADALGLPVEVAEDAGNVGVRGAVIAARVAAGTLDGYAPDGFFPVAARYDPRTNTRDHHARQFGRFKQAYPALKGLFASADG
jgi:xylulokinase